VANIISITNQNGKLVVSSREVARNFEKEHKHVLDSIDSLIEGVAEKSADLFISSTYKHKQNKQVYREYLLTRDGFTLLAMGFSGKKALEWKLKYIEAFNKMEYTIINQQKQIAKLTKQQEIEARLINSKVRQANVLLKIAKDANIEEYKQVLHSYASQIVTGKRILPLPEAHKETYSAKEIGDIVGMSANMVGRLANTYGLKTEQYGKLFYDKSAYSNKQVETFRYYDTIIPVLKNLSSTEVC
jgi:Rha family phage regulatory protein